MDPGSWRLVPRRWRHTCSAQSALAAWQWLLPGVSGAQAWLRARAVRPGQRLGLVGANTPATAALLQAAPLSGVTLVLFNRRLTRAEFAAQRAATRIAALAMATGSTLDEAGALLLPETFADQGVISDEAALADDAPALVLFTSGTTGIAKAARLSFAAVTSAATAAVEHLTLRRSDVWLGCLPLDHIGGASVVYRAAVCGYTIRLVERFAAAAIDRILDQDRISGLSVVPTMLHRLVAVRAGSRWPRRLRTVLTGGGPLDTRLIAEATALGRAPCQSYGLTEAASQVCTLTPAEAARHPGSCGRPLPGMTVRIRARGGHQVPPGRVGVIEVRGAALFSGYERSGRLTRSLRRGSWFATGDLGELDADGRLTVHCRRTDLIVSGGENVYPAEVEDALMLHPRIAEAAVYPRSDREWGQVVVVALVARGRRPSDHALATWFADHLAAHRRPRRWTWVVALPRTATGKLQRQRLAAWCAAAERAGRNR